MLQNFSPPRSLDIKFGKRRREEISYILDNDVQTYLCLYKIINLGDQPICHVCVSPYSMCKKKDKENLLMISFRVLDR